MISLDTNTIIRYLLNDIPKQTTEVEKVLAASGAYITDLVLTETVFVLERVIDLPRSEIQVLLGAFLQLPMVTYNDYLLDPTLVLYSEKTKLSFVDCYAAVEAQMHGHQLLTFDAELVQQGLGTLP